MENEKEEENKWKEAKKQQENNKNNQNNDNNDNNNDIMNENGGRDPLRSVSFLSIDDIDKIDSENFEKQFSNKENKPPFSLISYSLFLSF